MVKRSAESSESTTSNQPECQEVSAVEPPSQVESLLSSIPGTSTQSNGTNESNQKRQKVDDHIPTGIYLDQTVVPILRIALITLDRNRPADPVQYVIDFLLRHKDRFTPNSEALNSQSADQTGKLL